MKRLVNMTVAVAAMLAASGAGSVLAQNTPGNPPPSWPHANYAQAPWPGQQVQPAAQPAAYGQTPAYPETGAYGQPQPHTYPQPPAYAPPAYSQDPSYGQAGLPTYQTAETPAIQNQAAYGQSYTYGAPGQHGYAASQQAGYPVYDAGQGAPAIQSTAPAYPGSGGTEQSRPIEKVGFEDELAILRQKVNDRIERTTNNVFGTAAYRNYGHELAPPAPAEAAPAPGELSNGSYVDGHQQVLADPNQYFGNGCGDCATCDTGCSTCEDSCCDPCCQNGLGIPACGFWYGSASAIWITPRPPNEPWVNDPANTNFVQSYGSSYSPSLQGTVGYTGANGYGAQVIYWDFDDTVGTSSFTAGAGDLLFAEVFAANTSLVRNAFAGPGETLNTEYSLRVRSLDLEATSLYLFGDSALLVGFGVRYARLEQHFVAEAIAGGVVDELVEHRHGFEGWGPTLSGEFRRALWWPGLVAYANARGAILFGERYQDIYEVKMAGAMIGQDSYDGDVALPFAGLGLGLEYNHAVGANSFAFVRLGYLAQMWFDAGGPTALDGNLGFGGILLTAGLRM